MRKSILISIVSFLFFSAATAQKKSNWFQEKEKERDTSIIMNAPVEEEVVEDDGISTKPNDTLYIDTTLYYYKLTVPKDSVTAWKNMPSFAYMQYLDSLLKAKKASEKKKAPKETDNIQRGETNTEPPEPSWLDKSFASSGLQFFLWTLAIVFVLFVLYKLFLTEGAFRRKTMSANTPAPSVEEEVITSESNFTQLIKQALQNSNYRLAVRYNYLQTLNKLAGKNLVTLAADKTNYQYVREISNSVYQNDFAALTLNYEYVWYGEFNIEENIYRSIENGFIQLNNKL